ncbi:hypothetical protein [Streptomyces manipurensis]
MPFSEWRTRVRLNHALGLLEQGQTVQAAPAGCGCGLRARECRAALRGPFFERGHGHDPSLDGRLPHPRPVLGKAHLSLGGG